MRVDTYPSGVIILPNTTIPAVFPKNYFDFAVKIQKARSFKDLCNLLTTEMPSVVGGNGALLFLTKEGHEVEQIYGNGDMADGAKHRLESLNDVISSEPFSSKVDFEKPGDLGFAVSDFAASEDFHGSGFCGVVCGDGKMEDGLFGMLAHSSGRTTMLLVCREDGSFSENERGLFDSILLSARSVASLIMVENVRGQVTRFYKQNSAHSAQALYAVKDQSSVNPLNHESLRLSEDWWGEDEPFYTLRPEDGVRLSKHLEKSWDDPLTPAFGEIQLDLGGGLMTFNALPGSSEDESFLVLSLADKEAVADEALKSLLTRRQREIMEWIAQGKTSAEAAIILDISPRTVEKHLEAIFQRLGVENRISAVRTYLDIKSGQFGSSGRESYHAV